MKRSSLYFSIICLLLLGALLYGRSITRSAPVPPTNALEHFPNRIGPWEGKEIPIPPDVLQNVGADDFLNRVYHTPSGATLWFYVGYYEEQRRGDQIHSPLHCYPGSGWNTTLHQVVPIRLGNRRVRINKLIIQHGEEKRIVAYWYQCQKQIIANEFVQRFNLIVTALRKHRTDGSLVRVSTSIHDNTSQEGWQRIVSFLQDAYPQLMASIPE
jgi:EpsI family protein